MEEGGIRKEIVSNLFTAFWRKRVPPKCMQRLENEFQVQKFSTEKRFIFEEKIYGFITFEVSGVRIGTQHMASKLGSLSDCPAVILPLREDVGLWQKELRWRPGLLLPYPVDYPWINQQACRITKALKIRPHSLLRAKGDGKSFKA